MVRDKEGDRLDGWLDAAAASELASFARGLRQDLAAVRAALVLPWSTSPVEGQINRLKTIKRQMYGRAGFDLLRQRVLTARPAAWPLKPKSPPPACTDSAEEPTSVGVAQ